MRIVPLTLREANNLVGHLHRHHAPVQGHRFSIGLVYENRLVGAAIIGRPVAPATEQFSTAEITRLVTDGTPNACSALYGAAARICREMGFDSIQTFILDSEPGTSLKASGWIKAHKTRGGDWYEPSRHARSRSDQPQGPKVKWVRLLNEPIHFEQLPEKKIIFR